MYRFIYIPEKYYQASVWKENTWLRMIEPFKGLYDRDLTEDKRKSNLDMIAIWLYCDPSYQNKIGKLKEEQKKQAILAFHPEFDFDDDLIVKCIVAYPDVILTDAARALVRSLRAIERLQDIIEEQLAKGDLTLDEMIPIGNNRWIKKEGTAKQLLDLKSKLAKTWKEFMPIQKAFEEEQVAEGRMYGGGQRTLLDEGGLQLLEDED